MTCSDVIFLMEYVLMKERVCATYSLRFGCNIFDCSTLKFVKGDYCNISWKTTPVWYELYETYAGITLFCHVVILVLAGYQVNPFLLTLLNDKVIKIRKDFQMGIKHICYVCVSAVCWEFRK
jgi:hypothetical protein